MSEKDHQASYSVSIIVARQMGSEMRTDRHLLKLMILALPAMALSCSTVHERENEIPGTPVFTGTDQEAPTELTPEQQAAFDALNTLQLSTDQQGRLYSTFANIEQPCYPPDTSITISRDEFLAALVHFVSEHCSYLPAEKREGLARTAAQAQGSFRVSLCTTHAEELSFDDGLPFAGTWVLPGVLDRRDVVLVW